MQKQSTLFAADTPANPSRRLECVRETKTLATSGRKCDESFEKFARAGSFVRTFADMFASVSIRLPHNWKTTASPSGRLLSQLLPLAPRTGATGFGSSATIGAGGRQPSPSSAPHSQKIGSPLNETAMAWPTPTANRRSGLQSHGRNAILGPLNPAWVEALMGYPAGWTSRNAGPMAVGKPEFPALPPDYPTESSD